MKCVPEYVQQPGASKHPLYPTYRAMLYRCYDEKNDNFKWYGARGIKVCLRWRLNFFDFAADVGEKPEGKSIDRIERHKGYEPGNVRWATKQQQAFTNSRTRQVNDTSARQVALANGLDPRVLTNRLRRGWDVERAVTTPVRGKKEPT